MRSRLQQGYCIGVNTDTVPEFHAEAPQATVSEGLVQGPYMAARAGVEPTTLRNNRLLTDMKGSWKQDKVD